MVRLAIFGMVAILWSCNARNDIIIDDCEYRGDDVVRVRGCDITGDAGD